jgi:hypothetical protein
MERLFLMPCPAGLLLALLRYYADPAVLPTRRFGILSNKMRIFKENLTFLK